MSLLITLLIFVIGRTGFMHELELKTYDQRFMLRGPQKINHSDVLLVTIDDEDFAALDIPWPFPRNYHAKLIQNLLDAGARIIIYDVNFFGSSPDSSEDAALARATAEAGDRLILVGNISYTKEKHLENVISEVRLPSTTVCSPSALIGMVNEIEDRDGFVRQSPIYFGVDNSTWLPVALMTHRQLSEYPDAIQLDLDNPWTVRFGDLEIPRMARNTFLVNYYGPSGTFPSYSFSSVLDDSDFELAYGDTDYIQWFTASDAEFDSVAQQLPSGSVKLFRQLRESNPFRDKIVFVGAAAPSLKDMKRTPYFAWSQPDEAGSENIGMPGVEALANAWQTVADQKWIRNAPVAVEIAITVLLVLLVFLINSVFGAPLAALSTIVLTIAYGSLSHYAFRDYGIWLSLVTPLTAILTMFIFTSIYRYASEQQDKTLIRNMFSQYVPKEVVDQLISNPESLKLGGERRRMTVMFTDLVGFTSIAEQLSADELVPLLNDYLSEMSQIILANHGIIDKYEGDLIMAEWGAPILDEHHAVHACNAALQMQKRMSELRMEFIRQGRPPLSSRIGINTGDMIVGNMGCLEVFDYTVMGDAVNLASRIERANKGYGTRIIIGPETYNDVRGQFVIRPLDNLRVDGRDEAIRIYELVARSERALSEQQIRMLSEYLKGWRAYQAREFESACHHFELAFEIDPEDGPTRTYHERCRKYAESPPPENWDGVHVFTEK